MKFKLLKPLELSGETKEVGEVISLGDTVARSESEVFEFALLMKLLTASGYVEKYDPNARWKPKNGEIYYYLCSTFEADPCTWLSDHIDNNRYNLGNVFATKALAEEYAIKVKGVLKGNLN